MIVDGPATDVYRTVGGIELAAHVFRSGARGKRPAIVFLHGGNLTGGSPDEFYPEAAYLAERGMVAASVAYRLMPNEAKSARECAADAQAAVAWLRQREDVDPARVVACGFSAGGLLAASTALDDPLEDLQTSCRPDALVLFNATLDSRWLAPGAAALAGGGTPPTLLLHGNRDTIATIGRARKFAQAMTAAGNRCELAEFDGAHTFWRPIGRNGIDGFVGALRRLDAFLTELGYLGASATSARIAEIGDAMQAAAVARRTRRGGRSAH